jgi:hypothetical protein
MPPQRKGISATLPKNENGTWRLFARHANVIASPSGLRVGSLEDRANAIS